MKLVPTTVIAALLLTVLILPLLWVKDQAARGFERETASNAQAPQTNRGSADVAEVPVPSGVEDSEEGIAEDAWDGASVTRAAADAVDTDGIWMNKGLFEAEQLSEWAERLREAGLSWPRRNPNLLDGIAAINLRQREPQAMRMIDHDVGRAVDFITAQVAFEEDKVRTRRLRETWEASKNGAADSLGDPALLTAMIRQAPDRHFNIMVDMYVDARVPASNLEQVIGEAMVRSPSLGLPALARLADRGLLPKHGGGARARQALIEFLDAAPREEGNWHFAVVDQLAPMERPEPEAAAVVETSPSGSGDPAPPPSETF